MTIQSVEDHVHGRKILVAVLLSCVVAGCVSSPPPRAKIQQDAIPNIPLTNPWKVPGAGSGGIEDDWIASFRDTQLMMLVGEALTYNPDVRIAATRVEQAAAYVTIAKAQLLPAVSLLGTGGFRLGGGDVTSALQGILLSASWEPDLWGRLRYGRNATQEAYASVQADLEYARQSLAAQVAKGWFTATETLLQRQLAEEMVRAADALVALAGTRWRVGIGNEQDVALARANLGNFQEGVTQVRRAHEQTLRALELLLGRYPAAELRARADLPKLPGEVPAGLPLNVLERRPDVIAAERRVAVAFNRVGEARKAMLPRIVLTSGVGAIGSQILQLRSDFENPTVGAGARLNAPIYQGGALLAQVEIRTAEQKEAVAQYARVALRSIGDVETALAAAQTLAEREQLLRQVIGDNQRALDLAEIAYRVGQLDLRSVRQQQLAVYAARVALLRVESEQLSQRVNLHLALGGGFEQMPATTSEAAQTR